MGLSTKVEWRSHRRLSNRPNGAQPFRVLGRKQYTVTPYGYTGSTVSVPTRDLNAIGSMMVRRRCPQFSPCDQSAASIGEISRLSVPFVEFHWPKAEKVKGKFGEKSVSDNSPLPGFPRGLCMVEYYGAFQNCTLLCCREFVSY
jgi:hypothetical protein